MKRLSLFILFFLLASCNEQRSDRTSSAEGLVAGTSPFTSSSTNQSSTTASSGLYIPEEISHCQWSQDGISNFSSQHAHLSLSENDQQAGAYTLCRSQTNSNNIYIQVKTPIVDVQTCFLPTFYTGDQSTFIGEPRCLFLNSNQKIYKIDLLVNRSGYIGYPIQGVMIMKDKSYYYPAPYNQNVLSPDAYIYCHQMLALNDYSYCQAFSEQGHYVSIKF